MPDKNNVKEEKFVWAQRLENQSIMAGMAGMAGKACWLERWWKLATAAGSHNVDQELDSLEMRLAYSREKPTHS